MYFINDKTAAIRAVQRYLGLNQSGIYDKATLDAVISHQMENDIEPSGVVDFATFESLRLLYIENQMIELANRYFSNPRFPYKIHDYGNDVGIINSRLSDTLIAYTYEGILPYDNYYSRDTEKAVARLREIYGLKDGKEVDEELYVMLTRDALPGMNLKR